MNEKTIIRFGLLFWLFFFPLRKNAGGFHAKTQMGCIFFSIVALFLDYYFWEQIIRIKMICVMVSAICCILSVEVVVFIISIACDWEWGILCVGKSPFIHHF